MKAAGRMSESEAQVMELLWEAGQPVPSSLVIEQLRDRQWKASTVWTFLGRLEEKGLIRVERQGRRSLYSPALSREEYRRAQTDAFLDAVHGGSVRSLISALDGGQRLSREELEELRQWLNSSEGGDR